MSTLAQMRHGLEQARDTLAMGWRHLRERAGNALTRFSPPGTRHGQVQTSEEARRAEGTRWGLLAAEVMESDDAVEVRLEVPGLRPEDIDLSVQDQFLVVRGEKEMRRDTRQGRYFLMERAYGAFERAIPLPARVKDDNADARYQEGVLTVRLPKAENARRRRINVEVH